MVSTIITICIYILAFAVGLYIGSIIFGKEIPEFNQQNKIDELEQKLRDAPMVRTFEFRQTLTKAKLMEDVLKPCMVEFCKHFYGSDESFKYDEYINKLADRIMQWYNPEYGELVLVAHDDGTGIFKIDWTWNQPERKPKYICHREAIEGMEKYYEDELGNPMVLGIHEG